MRQVFSQSCSVRPCSRIANKKNQHVQGISFRPDTDRSDRFSTLNKVFITSAEREVKDSCSSGMFQSCIRMSRSCFGICSRYLRVLLFILSGEINNYEKVLPLEEIKNK